MIKSPYPYILPRFKLLPISKPVDPGKKKLRSSLESPEYWLLNAIMKQKANMAWKAPDEF